MANRPTSDSALPKKVQCRSLLHHAWRHLESVPGCYLHRCNDPWLIPSKRLCLSIILANRTRTENVSQDTADLVLVAPVWQAQPWWPAPLIKNPVMIPNAKHCAEGSSIPSENPPNVQFIQFQFSVPQAPFSRLFTYQRTASDRRVFRGHHHNTPISVIACVLTESLSNFSHPL